ncbi:hemerythrin domain-containing protein [Dactylosporangium sp. CA-233914]|uniref:hemerythrin domain-containing protein n=1 Tax=Dactylosporangium sp. CA-233914 TaxID=3239934 RepID=UPI003D8C4314
MELLVGIRRMQHAIQTPVGDPAFRPAVSRAVEQLKVAFAEHVEVTEGPAGLYAEVLGDAPRLAPHLDDLVGDHRSVWTALDELEGRLSHRDPAEAVRWQADRLIREVWQHRQRGADLLHEAYETDLGGET